MKLRMVAADTPSAMRARDRAIARYGQHHPDEATAVVAFGGDGFLLSVLHDQLNRSIETNAEPRNVYGFNYGTVGFLTNACEDPDSDLHDRIAQAVPVPMVPLCAQAHREAPTAALAGNSDDFVWKRYAFNEVTVRRAAGQAAHLRVSIDGQTRLEDLAGDGLILATAGGSAAYSYSAGGPVLPLSSKALALTPICPISPRRWPGAVLPSTATVRFDVLQPGKRPVEVTADMHTLSGDIRYVTIASAPEQAVNALFDPGHELDERLLAVQFA